MYQILALESDVVAAMESLREHTTALTMGTIGSVCAAASDDSNADADGGGCGVHYCKSSRCAVALFDLCVRRLRLIHLDMTTSRTAVTVSTCYRQA